MEVQQIIQELDILTTDAFNKAVIKNKWSVFTKEQIDSFVEHVTQTATNDDDIEKARKDISKLVGKVIVDSIGRRKTVYVKPMDMIRKDTKTGTQDVHADALARHHHNTKVQRMGKEASLKQVERHFGKEVTDKIRNDSVLKPEKPVEEVKVDEKNKSGVEYMTSGRNKINVHNNAIEAINMATGKASNQADIENAKSLFVRYMIDKEEYTEKQSVITFHKFLKTGDNEQIISNGTTDGGYFTVDMEDVLVQAGRKPETKENKKVITSENYDAKVEEYTAALVKRLEKDGVKDIDAKWRAGIKNNFMMLTDHIDNKDVGALQEFLTSKNQEWKRFFTDYTGISLPLSDKDTSMFLFKMFYNKK